MNGVFRLIQNEISKIFHQMSWKILTLLLLLLSVAAPVLNYVITAGDYNYYANAEERAEECEEGSIEREYFLTLASAYKYFISQGFDEDSWQYGQYMSEYADNLESIRGCQLFIEGKVIDEIIGPFYIEGVGFYWDDEKGQLFPLYYGNLGEEQIPAETDAPRSYEITGGYYEEERKEFTPEIAQLIIEDREKANEEIKEKLQQPFSKVVEEQIEAFKPYYESAKAAYEAAKAAYETDKSKIQEYVGAKLIKEGYDILFEALNRTDFSKFGDNINKSYMSILLGANRMIEDAGSYAPISQKEFDEMTYEMYFMGERFTVYEDYVKALEQRQEQYYRAMKVYAYSLEHNIPLLERYSSSSTRSILEECLNVNITVIMLMGIFMAAVMVASEHTSGAVRLLMIRPRARWKILLSKLCCLLFYMLCWIVSTSALSTVTNSIIYGVEDLSVPYIMVGGGEAFEAAPFLYYLQKITISSLPALSMVCLAFLMSALVKRAVVSMAIPMIINIFGGPASSLFIGEACKKCPPLKLTPIPYFDLASFWGDPFDQLRTYNSPLDYGLTLNMGVVMFVIYSLLLIGAAFVVFKKQQIKN